MSDQIKSPTCPSGSTSTPSELYCQSDDIIMSPAEYSGERVGTCGSNQSSARGVPFFKVDADEMDCIREGFKNLGGGELGIPLPKEYFYFDNLSNIEGSVCLNTSNVVSNVGIVEEGMDVLKKCLEESGNGNVEYRAKRFAEFANWHTPPDVHGTSDWIKLGILFGVVAPAMGLVLTHFYHKYFGPKGPPSGGGGSGGGGSKIEVVRGYSPRGEVVKFGETAKFVTLTAGAALLLRMAATVGQGLAQVGAPVFAASGAGGAGGGMAFSALEGTAAVSAGGAGASAGTGAAAAGAGAGTFGAGAVGVAAVVGVLLGAGIYASGIGELIGTTQLGDYIGEQWYEALNGSDYSTTHRGVSKPKSQNNVQVAMNECVEEEGFIDQWCD